MANISKLKSLKRRRIGLGKPPLFKDASKNLKAPESAPSDLSLTERIDGRSARRTNRTLQFATRVTPEWDNRIRYLARREGVMLVEILERALDYYETKP